MSVYGDWLTVTVAQNGTKSSEVNLGKDYDYLEIQIPALDTCSMNLEVSMTSGGTFQNLSGVTEAVATGAYDDVWYLGGWQFIKLECSAAQTSAKRTFYVRGMRY